MTTSKPRSKTKEIEIRTLSKYIEYVEKKAQNGFVLYRGQAIDRPLIPKVGRIKLKDELKESEEKMIRNFKLFSLPFISIDPVDDWDWIALAQHHWLPTRLLDWTENPLIALWFAVNSPPNIKDGIKEDGVVWIFKPQREHFVAEDDKSPYRVNKTKVFQPKHITKRISAQSGWFTVHKYIEDKKSFIKMETNRVYKPQLEKLIIPAESFATLRKSLDICNVNSATVFPDIDGLSRLIQWKNSFYDDEIVEDELEKDTLD